MSRSSPQKLLHPFAFWDTALPQLRCNAMTRLSAKKKICCSHVLGQDAQNLRPYTNFWNTGNKESFSVTVDHRSTYFYYY